MAENHELSNQPESNSSSDRQQSDGVGSLRPLAPKPPAPAPLPPISLTLRGPPEQPAGTSQLGRRSPAVCPVCYRTNCQLPTHIASSRLAHSSKSTSPVKSSIESPQHDPAFASSYAYQAAQHYANPDIAVARDGVVPTYKFPLGPEMNTPEMSRLFHAWFMIEARDAFRIPRPPELGSEIICSPFFLPALQDPLLCLAVLAGAVAGDSLLSGHPKLNVKTLTLIDRAIQQLQERIQADPNNISDITITAAVFLWAAHIFLEDSEGMKLYSKTVFAAVESRGGLVKLGMVGAVEQIIRWADAIHSFTLAVPCHYRDAPDPGLPSTLPPRRYGSYWSNTGDASNIKVDTAVRNFCQETCRELEILEHAETKGTSIHGYSRYIRRMCVLYTRASVLRSQNYDSGPVNGCISIAAALLHFHCLQNWKYFKAGGRTNITALATAIRNTGGPTFWQGDLDLLTWLLLVAVIVPIEQEEQSWCFQLLCRVILTRFAAGDGLEDKWKEELRTSLQHFIWCDMRMDDLYHKVCMKIEGELNKEDDGSDSDV